MNKGFSLVELIVVIAIMAILVGVAVPVYTQYIGNAEDGVEQQYVEEVERAINTAYIDYKSGLSDLDKETYTNSVAANDTIKITGNTIVKGTDTTLTADNCALVELLNKLITLDSDSDVAMTFTVNTNGSISLTDCDADWYED